MSTGTILFCAGIVVFVIAIIMTIATKISIKNERKALEERLQKDY
jgi:hypothetical protein